MIRKRVSCVRKEKQENKIGENLSREKRRKEKMHARRRNLTELKGNWRDNKKCPLFQDRKPGRFLPNESVLR
jgi:hypothetical protein